MKNIFTKLAKILFYVFVGVYVIFLVFPFIVNPILYPYSEQISKLAEESTGLNVQINKLGLVTTPKLTIGVKIHSVNVKSPKNEEIVSAENIQAKLSILPLLIGKIEADVLSIENIDAELKIKPDGNFEIIDFLPEASEDDNQEQLTGLPLGLKLSNKLPNIYINEYFLTTVDMRDKHAYSIQGKNLRITDFILNKKVKFSTAGIAVLNGTQQFTYDINVKNYIMPDIDLNELVFAQNTQSNDKDTQKKTLNNDIPFNFMDIFKAINKNGLTADTKLDVKLLGSPENISIYGDIDIQGLSLIANNKRLPNSFLSLKFKNNKANLNTDLYSAVNEKTSIAADITHGKNPKINLNLKSNAEINNLFNIIKSLAESVNYNELKTLTATGNIDADFNLKSDLKKISSSGYFKIPKASIKYPLYSVSIDNIKANADFSENNLNLTNTGFTIFSQPLSLYGTLSNDAIADLHLAADKLSIKGLIAALGQISLLKDNNIKSGTLSMNAELKGPLKKIEPAVNILINNVDVHNKPSSTGIKLLNGIIKLTSDNNIYKGEINTNDIKITNPAANFTIPNTKITLNEKDINISDTYLMFNNSKININGKITDYTNKNINIDLSANGSIISNDLLKLIPADFSSLISAKGSLPLLVKVTGNDKKQTVYIQLLSTPNGYLHIMDIGAINGKSALFNAKLDINGENINISDTGIYPVSIISLAANPAKNINGSGILKVTGAISNFADPQLKNLNISTAGTQNISIPTFNKSSADINANITLSGRAMNPNLSGSISSNTVSIPTIKTTLKNITISLGKSIDINIPGISVDNSIMSFKAAISPNFSNGIIINGAQFDSNMFDADTLGAAFANMPSANASNQNSGSSNSDLGIIIKDGKGRITKFKTGKIVATELTSDFNLKNNVFYLKNMTGKAFNGKINGNIGCNIISGKTNVDISGSGMKAVEAIDASAGIPNALSGTLGFSAKLSLDAYAKDYNAMIKSVDGNADFNVKNGNYLNIGTIDQFVLAGNVASNAIIRAALIPIKNMPVIKNSSAFTDISGAVKISGGNANLSYVKSTGNSIAYYVTGYYNLINGYTNVIILGRMGADVVAVLGPLGDLSVSKLSAYLPKFGANTLNLLSNLTTNPANENVSQIPALSGGNTNYKDFKVIFNGNITNPASIKTFKWLSTCDTSEITSGSIKAQVKESLNTLKTTGQNNINDAKKAVDDVKNTAKATSEDIKNQVQKTKDSINELKNLKNLFKAPTSSETGAQ